jgi:putative endonuclease
MSYLVFIAKGPRGALKVGRARNLGRRSTEACENNDCRKVAEQPHRLVYFEFFQTLGDAIQRERQLKTWERRWKVELIERVNPRWDDLSGGLMA